VRRVILRPVARPERRRQCPGMTRARSHAVKLPPGPERPRASFDAVALDEGLESSAKPPGPHLQRPAAASVPWRSTVTERISSKLLTPRPSTTPLSITRLKHRYARALVSAHAIRVSCQAAFAGSLGASLRVRPAVGSLRARVCGGVAGPSQGRSEPCLRWIDGAIRGAARRVGIAGQKRARTSSRGWILVDSRLLKQDEGERGECDSGGAWLVLGRC
jgi:hypothetical protein